MGAAVPGTWTVVVWNLNEARAARARSWEVLDGFASDVALLSEARVPPGRNAVAHGKTIGRDCKHANEEDCRGRLWSTAVVSPYPVHDITDAKASRRGKALDIPFEPSRPGTWVAASVEIPRAGPVAVVSIYGLTDEKSDASVHRSLSDLEPIFEDRTYSRRLLVGGDLNIFANPRPNDPGRDRHLLVLDRIKSYGLMDMFEQDRRVRDVQREPIGDCPCGNDQCGHTWTFRSRNRAYAHIPYQDDHVFASKELADQLVSCESAGFNEASDHAPILVTFRV